MNHHHHHHQCKICTCSYEYYFLTCLDSILQMNPHRHKWRSLISWEIHMNSYTLTYIYIPFVWLIIQFWCRTTCKRVQRNSEWILCVHKVYFHNWHSNHQIYVQKFPSLKVLLCWFFTTCFLCASHISLCNKLGISNQRESLLRSGIQDSDFGKQWVGG
jgi:hypothetical protein